MTDLTPTQQRDAAINALLAAAVVWRADASDVFGDPTDKALIAAVDRYLSTRNDTDAARDAFLGRHSTAEAMQAELDRRRAWTPQ